ncbi:MAG: ELM1/GtrOC1 family putative glycosyltransferase, partial [Gammaproteobacteria bacterium]
MEQSTVIWRLTDGKRGHERQTEGLAKALASRVKVEVDTIAVPPSRACGFMEFCSGTFHRGDRLPTPELIIGAGGACQWPLLAARRARGGRAVYLMHPALPPAWFDLCIVPRHDRPKESTKLIVSDGPLNPMERTSSQRRDRGLILLGGPSSHHAWDTPAVVRDVLAIVDRRPEITWQISDSRRSPQDLGAAMSALSRTNARFVPNAQTTGAWLPEALGRSRYVWVSGDSVAMIYEALTAGAKVGIIDVPGKRHDRITGVAEELTAAGRVATLADWARQGDMTLDDTPFSEAGRCADVILNRWPEIGG